MQLYLVLARALAVPIRILSSLMLLYKKTVSSVRVITVLCKNLCRSVQDVGKDTSSIVSNLEVIIAALAALHRHI